jgi:hypothetical protein
MFYIRYLARCCACEAERVQMDLKLNDECSRFYTPSLPLGWTQDHCGRLYCQDHVVVLTCTVDGRPVVR